MSDNLRDLQGFDAMIAKRKERLGGDGTTFVVPGFGQDWHIAAPELQSAEWNDDVVEMRNDVANGYMSQSDFRDEFVKMLLGEQSDDFMDAADEAGIDPLDLLNWAIEQHTEQVRANPTRVGSRNIRRQQKRH